MAGIVLAMALTSAANAGQVTFYNALTDATPGTAGYNLNNFYTPANEFIALATGNVSQIEFYTYNYKPAIQKNIGVEVFQAIAGNPFATLLFSGSVATNSANDEILNVSGLSLIAGDTYTLQLQNLQDTSGAGLLTNYLNWSAPDQTTSTLPNIPIYENGSATPAGPRINGTGQAGSALITGTTGAFVTVSEPGILAIFAVGFLAMGFSVRKKDMSVA